MTHRVGADGQPAHAPLRTVRESSLSHGSGLFKNFPAQSVPAICINVSILTLLIHPQGQVGQSFCGVKERRAGSTTDWNDAPRDHPSPQLNIVGALQSFQSFGGGYIVWFSLSNQKLAQYLFGRNGVKCRNLCLNLRISLAAYYAPVSLACTTKKLG
jgi:hypothetical protein